MSTGTRAIVFVAMSALLMAAACDDKAKNAEADAGKAEGPKAKEGDPCKSGEDCEYGLSCAKDDNTCQTSKTIECRGRDEACKAEGRCYGNPGGGCEAKTPEDCKQSKICEHSGRCTPQDGKCMAVSREDCADICARMGKCSPVDGKCVAATDDDCKLGKRCEVYDECRAKDGQCVK